MHKLCVLPLLFLLACASGNRKERAQLRSLYLDGKYQEAITVLEKGDIKGDDDSKLLYLWEMGKLNHNLGYYEISTKYFQQAQELSKKYYTKSITKVAGSYVTNDNYQVYDGELFERSLSFFYQSLNYYLMYKTGKGAKVEASKKEKEKVVVYDLSKKRKRQALMQARAQILAWDSFFKTVQRSTRYDTIYKSDLIVKIYGGIIHESIGKRNDTQIALQLYKDAHKLLKYLGATYPTYNSKNSKFSKKFLKAKNKFSWKIGKKLLGLTNQNKNLKEFLEFKILSLTKSVRSRDFKKQAKRLKASKKIITKAKKSKLPNTSILIQEGIIVGKSAKQINFGFHGALKGIKNPKTRAAVHRIGSDVLTYFMISVLGLVPNNAYAQPGEFMFGHAMGRVTAEFASIDFEIPDVENKPITNNLIISFHQGTKKVKEEVVALIAPLDDLSSQAVEERVFSTYTKTGVRVGLKHLGAVIAAYAIYAKMGRQLPAKWAAVASYLAASKGIKATEKADIRFWSTLPKNLRLVDTYLKPGDYQIKVRSEGSITGEKDLGTVSVKGKKKNVFSYQITNF